MKSMVFRNWHGISEGKYEAAWLFLGLGAVLMVPSLVCVGEPFWQHPLRLVVQVLTQAVVYAAASAAAWLAGRALVRRLAVAVVVLSVGGASGYALNLVGLDLPYSKPLAAVAFALALVIVVLACLLRGWSRALALTALALVAGYSALLAIIDGRVSLGARVAGQPTFLLSAYYPLEITYHDSIVRKADVQVGGGLTRAGDRFIGVTGAGAFYLVGSTASGSIASERLSLASPLNAAAFAAAMPSSVNLAHFRVQGVITRRVADGWEVFSSHHVWDDQARTLALGLSKAVLDPTLRKVVSDWRLVFRSKPAFSPTRDGVFSGDQSGGRLAWMPDGRLLMTTGDHDFNGWNRSPAAAQVPDSDYGKTIAIDVATGQSSLYTMGHRNPQGLFVDADGRIWSTEQGPQGGDELNRLVAGGNYGWPLETYGTEYGTTSWPAAGAPPAGTELTPPVFAWVPSIGVSDLIEVEGEGFPRWQGNLLVASLKAQTLYRIVLDGDRVAYVEPLPIGRRIRDLVEGPRGDIWMWGDTGELITLAVKARSRGETVAAMCTACHSLHLGAGSAPSLDHIVGRRVASRSDYQYSAALKALGGEWTADRLDRFLENPGAFAPGTLMTIGVPNADDRAAVLAFLRDRR